MPNLSYTVDEFCDAHRISRSLFYKLSEDERPSVMKIGRRRVISAEAAAEWRRRMEANSNSLIAA